MLILSNVEFDVRSSHSRVNEKANEQVVDAIFANFDVILNVDIERRELFDVSDVIVAKMTSEVNEFLDRSEDVTDLKIENFDVVDVVEKVVVIEMLLLSFSLLKFRFETSLIIFFA